jgi:hypothetical protein
MELFTKFAGGSETREDESCCQSKHEKANELYDGSERGPRSLAFLSWAKRKQLNTMEPVVLYISLDGDIYKILAGAGRDLQANQERTCMLLQDLVDLSFDLKLHPSPVTTVELYLKVIKRTYLNDVFARTCPEVLGTRKSRMLRQHLYSEPISCAISSRPP